MSICGGMPYLPEIKYAIRNQEDYYNHCLHLRDHGYGHSQTSSHSSHLQMDMMLYMSLLITLQRWLTSFLASPTVMHMIKVLKQSQMIPEVPQ